MWEKLLSVARHPAFAIYLTVLALASAFSIGLVAAIGMPLFPLIDMVGLLFVVGFQATLLALFIRISWFYALGVLNRQAGDAGARGAAAAPSGTGSGWVIPLFKNRVFGVSLVILSAFAAYVSMATVETSPLLSSLCFVFVLVLLTLYAGVHFLRKGERRQLYYLQVGLLGSAFAAGGIWIETVKLFGGSVQMQLVGDTAAQRVLLLLAVGEGVIVYRRDDRTTHYVPLAQVADIVTVSATD
jgi:hypothetical protein